MAGAGAGIVASVVIGFAAFTASRLLDSAGEYLGGLAYDATVSALSAIQNLANSFMSGLIDAAEFGSTMAGQMFDDLTSALGIDGNALKALLR